MICFQTIFSNVFSCIKHLEKIYLNIYQRSRLRRPISKIRMVLLMDAKIWMTSLIIMFAVRPTCVQDSLFKMSSESPDLCLCSKVLDYPVESHHIWYNKDTWASRHLTSLTTRLLIQQLVQANNKEHQSSAMAGRGKLISQIIDWFIGTCLGKCKQTNSVNCTNP